MTDSEYTDREVEIGWYMLRAGFWLGAFCGVVVGLTIGLVLGAEFL